MSVEQGENTFSKTKRPSGKSQMRHSMRSRKDVRKETRKLKKSPIACICTRKEGKVTFIVDKI